MGDPRPRLGSAVVVGPVPGAIRPGVAGHGHLLDGGEAIWILSRGGGPETRKDR